MQKLLCTKGEAAEALACSVRTVENMIARKILASRKLGRRRMVVVASLVQLAKHDTPVITGSKTQSGNGKARS
jgi:excisionase family DNA binding protein